MPYLFCNDGGTYDDVDWVFEQDCDPNYTQYSDFFIFRVALTGMSSSWTYYDYQPENAVYFGEYDGDEYPTAIALDEYGFIYVAGTTNSVTLGS
jgi:hypothetical protein